MDSSQSLFLLEFSISSIKIDLSAMPVPQFQDLGVHLLCGTIIDIQILAAEFGSANRMPPINGEFDIRMGKTLLFPCSSVVLVQQMMQHDLDVHLMVSKKIVGSSTFMWRKEFLDMVQIFETIGVVKSVNYEGNFELRNSVRQAVGSMVLFIRMHCLGEHADTYLNLQGKEAIFINPKNLNVYKCDKYNFANDKINPVSTLYSPAGAEPTVSYTKLSWNELIGGTKEEETGSRGSGYDILKTHDTKTGSKILDRLYKLSANVDTREGETIINIAIDRPRKQLVRAETPESKKDLGSLLSIEGALTKERLNRKLCCNKDCDAIRKFNEYGIGPKYRPSGLGSYYEIIEPTTSHGMYHVFENLSRYGPTNFYRRPKDPYQRFYPGGTKYHGKQRIKDDDLCYCTPLPDNVLQGKELCCCCLQTQRLRGGGKEEEKKLCRLCKHVAEKHSHHINYPLRLRGGSIIEKDEETLTMKAWDPLVIEVFKKLIDHVYV